MGWDDPAGKGHRPIEYPDKARSDYIVSMVSRTFQVTGLVQGVGFRWSTQAEARRLGVFGWVTNGPGETVSGFVQGEETRVDAFCRWLDHGPPRARVETTTWTPTEPVPGLASFLVRP